jgi:5,10-methylenetetrahydromethanopterin reductase
MLVDIQIPNAPIREQLEMFRTAERLGYDGAGLADHVERGVDVFVVLAMAAQQTDRIALFPCVTNPLSRHPWVLANVMYTMEKAAPGRFRLVMGAGDSVPMHLGRKPATVAEMRDAVSSIRKLLRGEEVSFRDGPDEGIIGVSGEPAPVVVAAGARRMTELAGEAGDEAFLLTGFDERIVAMARRHIAAGAERSGRSLDGFKVTHYTVVHIEDDKEKAAEFGRARLLMWLKRSFLKSSLEELGVPATALADPDSIPVSELDRLLDSFFLLGPVDKIADQIHEVRRSGTLDRLVFTVSSSVGWQAAATALADRVLGRVH